MMVAMTITQRRGDRRTDRDVADALVVGRRIRAIRKQRGMTLEALARAVDRAPSQISALENGHREPRLGMLGRVAEALDVPVGELIIDDAPDERAALEIELERIQRSVGFSSLGLPAVRVGPRLADDALRTIVGLYRRIEQLRDERQATPEEARRANAELRREMREHDNHFEEIEAEAQRLLAAIGYTGGPLPQRLTAAAADHLGVTLHYVDDLPQSTRSVLDERSGRLYLPKSIIGAGDSRAAVLQALSSRVLHHQVPRDYAEFLRQRVESNYFAGAMLMPRDGAVALLRQAMRQRDIAIDDFRDAYAVSYEMAAHRFTNLATRFLDLPVHFVKVYESGTIWKAYENDDVCFPTDSLGAIEGQTCCRHWTCRLVFRETDHLSPFAQYTDTPTGTYWCAARVLASSHGRVSVSVGTDFAHARWFRGADTRNRATSTCPDEHCCRIPPARLREHWEDHCWPSSRPHASLLAALPQGVFPGVDTTAVYEFLERHAPDAPGASDGAG